MKECRRFYPHISPGEGQFLCLMKKSADGEEYIPKKKKKDKGKPPSPALSKDDIRILEKFFKDNLTVEGDLVFSLMEDTVMLAEDLPTHKAAVFCGVPVGTIVKGRLEPHHHLFSAMGKQFKRQIKLESTSDDAIAYLQGQVIDAQCENGWSAVLIDGCPAGGGKVVDGKVKNHYPKGLRLIK